MDFKTLREKLNNKGTFKNVKKRIKLNYVFSDYYDQLSKETGEDFFNKSFALKNCCRLWAVDYYTLQGVKDIKATTHCQNRFCPNCQSLNAKLREERFTPFLDCFKRRFDIYHLILTVPNVRADVLKNSVNTMLYQFGQLFRLFRGNAKIAGYNLNEYKILGAVRGFEITKNHVENTFHPHIHALLIVDGKNGKSITKNKRHINEYSFNREHNKNVTKDKPYLFSDFEILLQKIWRLKIDGRECTAENINALPLGYSVKCLRAKNYHEVFKYATKGVFEKYDLNTGYEDFKALHYTLENRRLIQGYGILNGFKFDGTAFNFDYIETLSETLKAIYGDKVAAEKEYKEFIKRLQDIETPQLMEERLNDIINRFDEKYITYISRASVYELITAGTKEKQSEREIEK